MKALLKAALLVFLLATSTEANAQVVRLPSNRSIAKISTIIRDSTGWVRNSAGSYLRFENRGDRLVLGFQSSIITDHVSRKSFSVANDSADAIVGTISIASSAFNIASGKSGTGSFSPLKLHTNGSIRTTLAVDGGIFMEGATGSSQGAGTINATGLYINGVAVGTSVLGTETKGFTLEDPTATDTLNLPIQFPYAITIDSVRAIVRGSASASVTVQFPHGTNIESGTANLLNGAQAVNNRTTGNRFSSFTDNTLAAHEWMRLITSAKAGTVADLTVVFYYRR